MVDFEAVKSEILGWMSKAIRVPVDQIDQSRTFAELGLDSLDAVDMVSTIERLIQQELPEGAIERTGCLKDIFEMMERRIAAA